MSPCPLTHELLQTLCIAEKLNFLHFTQEICRQHHIQDPPKSEAAESKEAKAETEPKSTEPVKSGIQLLEEGLEAIGLETQAAPCHEPDQKTPKASGQEAPPTEEEEEEGGERDQKRESMEIIGQFHQYKDKIYQDEGKDKILFYGMGAGKFKWWSFAFSRTHFFPTLAQEHLNNKEPTHFKALILIIPLFKYMEESKKTRAKKRGKTVVSMCIGNEAFATEWNGT